MLIEGIRNTQNLQPFDVIDELVVLMSEMLQRPDEFQPCLEAAEH